MGTGAAQLQFVPMQSLFDIAYCSSYSGLKLVILQATPPLLHCVLILCILVLLGVFFETCKYCCFTVCIVSSCMHYNTANELDSCLPNTIVLQKKSVVAVLVLIVL
jgi:hypothetical protein